MSDDVATTTTAVSQDKQNGLSALELLTEVFDALKSKYNAEELILPAPAMAVIADDSDWHRRRYGYTSYKSVWLFTIRSSDWFIAFGTKCGNYPAEPYNCDIAATTFTRNGKTNEEVALEIKEYLEQYNRFFFSPVFAMADGNLLTNTDGPYGERIFNLIRQNIQSYVTQHLETDPNYVLMDMRPVVTKTMRYKKEFVAFLSGALQRVIETQWNTAPVS